MSLSEKPDGYRKIGWTTGYICYRCGCLVTERAIHNQYHAEQNALASMLAGFGPAAIDYMHAVTTDLFEKDTSWTTRPGQNATTTPTTGCGD